MKTIMVMILQCLDNGGTNLFCTPLGDNEIYYSNSAQYASFSYTNDGGKTVRQGCVVVNEMGRLHIGATCDQIRGLK